MHVSRKILCFVFLLWLTLCCCSAGLPVDEPIVYPELEMDENLADAFTPAPAPTAAPAQAAQPQTAAQASTAAPAPLEMDERLMGENETAQPQEGDTVLVKPNVGMFGSRENKMVIRSVSNLVFDTPLAEAVVDFTNPEGSTVNVQYLVQISVSELLGRIGRSGYGEAAYAALQAEPGFSPDTHYIVLGQTKGIPPGKRVHTMALGTLPDGTALAAGTYNVSIVMSAFDVATNQRSMVGANIAATLTLLSDRITLDVYANRGALTTFTPADAASPLRYQLYIGVEDLTRALPALDVTGVEGGYYLLAELGQAEPGAFLEADFALNALPDGSPVPAGAYDAWIIRYRRDAATGEWINANIPSRVTLTVREDERPG